MSRLPRLDFDQPVPTLVAGGKRLVAQLSGPEFADFYVGCTAAHLDGHDKRDRLERAMDALERAHLEQGGAKEQVAVARGADDPHEATLVLFVEEAHDKLGMASKAGVPGARELRRGLKLTAFRSYGADRKALHVLDVIGRLREHTEALLPFGFVAEFLAMGDAAAQAVAPATTTLRQKLDAQKGKTSKVGQAEKAFEVAVVQVVLAHSSAERRLGRKLPALDLTLLLAAKAQPRA